MYHAVPLALFLSLKLIELNAICWVAVLSHNSRSLGKFMPSAEGQAFPNRML